MKHVSEIFGFPSTNRTQEVENLRKKHLCPFQGEEIECDPINKKSNLTDDQGNKLLEHQTGACSVLYKSRGRREFTPIIICPYRFLEKNSASEIKVLKYICDKFFKDKRIVIVPEIGLGAYGRADWIICELQQGEDIRILDFAHLEFQADATTGTRDLVICVKDFFDGREIQRRRYNFGLNSKASIKGSSLQMIDKGFLFKKLGKQSFWVLQDYLFDVLCRIYNIKMEDITGREPNKDESLIFIVTSLVKSDRSEKYNLQVSKCFATSVSSLQKAISEKDIISKELILNAVKNKLRGGNFFEV